MREQGVGSIEKVKELRRGFDRAFAEPPREQADAPVDLLAIQVANHPYALRLGEVAGLLADRRIVGLPSQVPDFLGVLGFRGRIIPAYSLRGLLGYPRGGTARWLVLTGPPELVGLAFDGYEGHVRVAHEQIAAPDRPEFAQQPIREVARGGDWMRPILSLPFVLETIKRWAPSPGPSKER